MYQTEGTAKCTDRTMTYSATSGYGLGIRSTSISQPCPGANVFSHYWKYEADANGRYQFDYSIYQVNAANSRPRQCFVPSPRLPVNAKVGDSGSLGRCEFFSSQEGTGLPIRSGEFATPIWWVAPSVKTGFVQVCIATQEQPSGGLCFRVSESGDVDRQFLPWTPDETATQPMFPVSVGLWGLSQREWTSLNDASVTRNIFVTNYAWDGVGAPALPDIGRILYIGDGHAGTSWYLIGPYAGRRTTQLSQLYFGGGSDQRLCTGPAAQMPQYASVPSSGVLMTCEERPATLSAAQWIKPPYRVFEYRWSLKASKREGHAIVCLEEVNFGDTTWGCARIDQYGSVDATLAPRQSE